jgi:hypothetical protein
LFLKTIANIFDEKWSKIAKNGDHNIGFWDNRQFLTKRGQKLPQECYNIDHGYFFPTTFRGWTFFAFKLLHISLSHVDVKYVNI